MKRTPWFDAMKDKPARVGEYEFKIRGCDILRMRWERSWRGGRGWRFSACPGDKWRGLAEKPRAD